MLRIRLDYLQKLEIIKEQKLYDMKRLATKGNNCSDISNTIKVCSEQTKEILDEKILENIRFSKRHSKDKQVAEFHYYFKFQPEFDEKGNMRQYTWEDAFLSVYPAPGDDIDRDLTEDEEAEYTKRLATEVDNCKRRIFKAIEKYEVAYAKKYLEKKKKI